MKKIKILFAAVIAAFLFPFFVMGNISAIAESPIPSENNEELVGDIDNDVLNEDGKEDIVDPSDEVTVDLSGLTYEQFLGIVNGLAESAGHGDLWKDTVSSVKKAVDEKQFTILTFFQIALLIVLGINLIVELVKKKKSVSKRKKEKEEAKKEEARDLTINGIAEVAEKTEVSQTETNKRLDGIEKALSATVDLLVTFSARTRIGDDTKEAIQQKANEAKKSLGGDKV